MILNKEETNKVLQAKSADALRDVLASLSQASEWDGKEPLYAHAACIFDGLQAIGDRPKAFFRDRQLSLTATDEDAVRVDFVGQLTDEELDNVSGGACDFSNYHSINVFFKPVIYLYPEKTTDVKVRVREERLRFSCVYPAFNKDGAWEVTASPDGKIDLGGKSYNYLYWEGASKSAWQDMSRGFCVAGKDTAAFLEDALARLGLSAEEANEFIVYWLPVLQENPYNLISFQGKTYDAAAPLEIEPKPDTLIRVFMAYRPLKKPVAVEPQELTSPERHGFTVVEWGGGRAVKPRFARQ